MRSRYEYSSYDEIPLLIQDYILTVSTEKTIMNISLEEINSFLNGMDAYLATKDEEFIEGWVE